MIYTIKLSKKSLKFISKQDKITKNRIKKVLLNLSENPFDLNNKNIKKLKGFNNQYRLRLADIRIKYEIINNELIIYIVDIDSRGQIYK